MKSPHEIVRQNEIHLEEFIEYQVENGPTSDYGRMARYDTSAASVLKASLILYPKFVLVEDQVVLADHYSEDNWRIWRERLCARRAANLVNHVHIDKFLCNEPYNSPLNDGLGHTLAFFWGLAVKNQFPNHNVIVTFSNGIVDTINQ